MKSQINILRQLQELVLTRDEHHQTGDGSHLDALNDSIDVLQQKLEPQVASVYGRLYKKNHIVISAMTNGCCAVCGMQVPIAQGQQVRLAQHLVTCSSCGRILFAADEDAAKNVSEPQDRDNPKTGISRFSAEELMVVDLDVATREEAIDRLAKAKPPRTTKRVPPSRRSTWNAKSTAPSPDSSNPAPITQEVP